MPAGYWSSLIAAVVTGTIVDAVIITLAYWVRVPVDGHTIIMPFEALFTAGLPAVIAAFVATIAATITNLFSPAAAIWVASAIFVLAVFVIIGSPGPSTAQMDRALGGLRFMVPTVLAAAWFQLVTRPLLGRLA